MDTIEVNGTFYSLQRATSFARWRAEAGEDFVFSVKGPRFVTHMKRLRDVDTPLANFFASGVLLLGPTLGPVLWQLPPTLPFDVALLEDFLSRLPRTCGEAAELASRHDERLSGDRLATVAERPEQRIRHALEVRHESFRGDALLELARRHDVALVTSDAPRRWPVIETLTSDHAYVRLHGDTELYASGYTDVALDRWAVKVRDWHDQVGCVHVYFDNDAKGHAPFDALKLRARLS
nr:DUF72 domain-containing protein [Auraticoccus cholistanensis]